MQDNKKTAVDRKVGLWGLVAAAVGMTVASGVFSLAKDFPLAGASQGAVIIGWLICGIGMFTLMRVFFGLSYVKPELKGGIYAFAKAGFGDWIGFLSAWGYWVCCFLCIVAFSNLLFSAIGYFIPFFGVEGNSLEAVIGGSIYLWILCGLILAGVEIATLINLLVTIAKMIPLFMFIILTLLLGQFNLDIFLHNFWGDEPLLGQINATAMITLWVFSGIEGCVVISSRARNMKDVAKGSAISFFFVLILYILITLLSMGVMPAAELAELDNPSLAYVMEAVVGPWGAMVINFGVVISLLGAQLAVVIITAEVANAAAKMGAFCRFFAKENKNNSPVNALILSLGLAQFFLIVTYFNESTFQAFYYLSASMLMLPYLLCALYYAKVVKAKEGFEVYAKGGKYTFEVFIAAISVIYGVWLVYAVGIDYLLYSCMFYAAGTAVYLYGKKEKKEKPFVNIFEYAVLGIVSICGVTALILILTGVITPF